MTESIASHPTASERIADFVLGPAPAHASAQATHVVERALLDTFAAALLGVNEPCSRDLTAYVSGWTAPQMATVWATGEKLPLETAALVNGTMGHALDYDDVSSPMRGHPSVVLLPALVALAEAEDSGGHEVVEAFVAGFEVIVRMCRAIVSDQYAKGWHVTSSIGTIGATAACARLLRLDRRQTVHALGVAVSQISGTRENFGTACKPLQAGLANQVAVRSALLARNGYDASVHAIDGQQGYTRLYADHQSLEEQLALLGTQPLEIDASGIEIKKYPLCYATHRAIDGVLDLLAEQPIAFDDIEAVDVDINYRALVPLIHNQPQTGLEGKFSMQYAVAAAFRDGHVRLHSFEDEAVQRPEIQRFMRSVRPKEGPPPMFPRWTQLTVHLRSGEKIVRRIEKLRGSAQLPLTDSELIDKTLDCIAYAGLPHRAEDVARAAFTLASAPVRSVIAGMTQARR